MAAIEPENSNVRTVPSSYVVSTVSSMLTGYEAPLVSGVFHWMRIGSPASYAPGGEASEASLVPPT